MASVMTTDISNVFAAAQASRTKELSKPYTGSVNEEDRAKMMTKAKEFEAFYIYQVMELMAPEMEGEFNGGAGEEMFRHTLNEHMSESITNTGGFGIAENVYTQLLKNQEAQNARFSSPASAAQAYANN